LRWQQLRRIPFPAATAAAALTAHPCPCAGRPAASSRGRGARPRG
jgi:hypothetical protein